MHPFLVFAFGVVFGGGATLSVLCAAAAVGEYHESRDRDPENQEI